MDAKVAFLHAPLNDPDAHGSSSVVVVKPPHFLVKLGYVGREEMFVADKAFYGLRQSPRCWSVHRDRRLRAIESVEGYRLCQAGGEANLWRIVRPGSSECLESCTTEGLVLVYVAHIFAAARKNVLGRFLGMLTSEWETSSPEHLNSRRSSSCR